MCGFSYKKKERKVLNSSLYSLTHRNARILKLVSLRVRRIRATSFFVLISDFIDKCGQLISTMYIELSVNIFSVVINRM